MKVYVAGKYQDRSHVRSIMDSLEVNGYEITYDWTVHDPTSDTTVCARNDIDGVRHCDVLLALVQQDFVYKGLFCEIGAALVMHKFVFLLGNAIDSCIFTDHHLIRRIHSMDDFFVETHSI